MCFIEIWYLWYIFYAKFIYILCKFYPVRSFDYSWNNNLIMLLCKRNICFILENFVLLLSHFLVISTENIDKVVSMLFSQRWSNVDEQTELSFSNKYKKVETTFIYRRWINVIVSRLFQRCFINVETTSINMCRLNFHFQPNINVETTLMNVDDQRCFIVESTLMCLLG